MKLRTLVIPLLSLILVSCSSRTDNRDMEMNRFIDQLMARMTLEEKLGQLNLPVTGDIVTGAARESNVAEDIRQGRVGGLFNLKGAAAIREVQRIAVEESRLGIPLLFGMDVIHGYETVFPIPLALSCSWDMAAVERSAQIAAAEATADGICWTFSPMVDICHDGRWGRISEGGGEDPYLGSRIAEAMVHGYQGTDLADPATMMACVKHFALYGAVEAGREYNNVYPDDFHMFNEYLQPYKAAVEAGAGSVMAAFNTVHGIPSTGNKWLLTDLLREQWGFDGFVVSDYCGLEQLCDHGVCTTKEEAAIQCLEAGLDMDMVSAELVNLADAVRAGRCSKKYVDQACRRMLEAKYKLGLFDDPYRYCDTTRRSVVLCPEFRAEARRIAGESMVLLKNDKNVLPLQKKGTIALIGPLANTRPNMSGTWAVAAVPEHYKTVKEGLEDALKGTNAKLLYAKGSNIMYDAAAEAIGTMFGREMRDSRSDAEMRAEALRIARQADVIVAAMGEASEMSGECSSRVNIEMPDAQHDLLVELAKLGKPIVLVHFAGRPTVLNWETDHLPAILEAWFGGSETADAVADILFGDVNPSGRLTVQLPRHVGQYPFSYRQMRTSRLNPQGEFAKFITCYADVSNWPLYPFGYGLSYTNFEYSPITLSCDQLPMTNANVEAKVTVTNSGDRRGTEVVQLYICDRVAKGVRPYKELRGFERITLEPGESKEVVFTIDADLLGYYEPATLQWTLEPGEVEIHIGRNARETDMRLLTVQ